MANICDYDFTMYCDDPLKIMILFAKLQQAWLGSEYGGSKQILRFLGCDEETIDKVDGRTYVEDIDLIEEDKKYVGVRVDGNCAWGPCEDFMRAIQKTVVPCEYVYVAVEPGCEIYVNTDEMRRFYKDSVYVAVCAKTVDGCWTYSDDELEDATNLLKKVTHMKIDNIMDLKDKKVMERVVNRFYKINPEEEDYYLTVHFFENA